MSISSSSDAVPSGAHLAARASPPVDAKAIVFHTDVFILAVIGLVVLVTLPRSLARFIRSSEWKRGYVLRHVPYYRSTLPFVQSPPGVYPPTKGFESDDSHTLYTHTKHAQRTDEKGHPIAPRYPPHVATCLRLLRPLATPLRVRIVAGFSMAQVIILVLYFCCLLYPAFLRSSPFTDPARAGWVAIAQLPFVFAYASKNNVLGSLLGLGYEKLNFLHRFVGNLVVIAANVHGVGFFYSWSLSGTFMKSMRRPSNIWALVALVCLDVIVVFSTQFWRQKAYNIFLSTHIVGFSILLPACWRHMPSMLPYIYAALGVFALDHLLRCIKTRFCTAVIRPLPELGVTRVEVPQINGGWRPGQHVRLRVLSSRMGWWGWSEAHPFTIASASGSQEGLVLMCKKAGGWTNKLYDMAKTGGYTEAGVGRNISVVIEGPYGGPGHAIFSSYSAAVFIVGGSGITFPISTIQDLIRKDLKGQSRVKVIELVWVVQDAASLTPLLPLFTSMIQQSIFTPLRISVHYTRASASSKSSVPQDFVYPGLSLAPGRPRVGKILEAAISRAVSLGAGAKDAERITGMLVGVCGPVELADDVVSTVGMVEPKRRDQVGGIEIHEEVFGW